MEQLYVLDALEKSYGQTKILDKVSFSLCAGQIVGLIGPSGAGKSTMIKLSLGMEKVDSGQSTILGVAMPNRQVLGKIGYMAQSDALYENLTAYENLKFFARMKDMKGQSLKESIMHVSKIVGLENDLSRLVSGFSGGMKRRLSLAIALLGHPQVLILDEPTVGIDPSLRLKIWQELYQLKDRGVGILVTTHVMDEAEKTDKVGLLLDGRLIALDTPTNLKACYGVSSIEEVFLKAEGEQDD
ncbi:ABC transporter ATP-binding protein [Streptococcus hongkongensis]|nr:glycosyl transferase family 2 [Streptococcus uberis]